MLFVALNMALNMFIAINIKTCAVQYECVAIASFIAATRLIVSVRGSC